MICPLFLHRVEVTRELLTTSEANVNLNHLTWTLARPWTNLLLVSGSTRCPFGADELLLMVDAMAPDYFVGGAVALIMIGACSIVAIFVR